MPLRPVEPGDVTRPLRALSQIGVVQPLRFDQGPHGVYLLKGMAERGELEGSNWLSPSSGNTGLPGRAGRSHGQEITITIPDGVPEEKKTHPTDAGAEVWATPDDLCPSRIPRTAPSPWPSRSSRGRRPRIGMPCPTSTRTRTTSGPLTRPRVRRSGSRPKDKFKYSFRGLRHLRDHHRHPARYLKEQDPAVRVIAIEPQKGHRLPS